LGITLRDYAGHALKCLEGYASKGLLALDAARVRDIDRLNELLSQRALAFYNFQASDRVAMKELPDSIDQDAYRRLWMEIEGTNRALEAEVEKVFDVLKSQLAKCSDGRAKVGRYLSGVSRQIKLETSV
jgi:hypothetical protein